MKELYPIDETNETETTQKTQKKCKGKKVTPKQFNDSTYKRLMIHEELRKSKIRNKLIQVTKIPKLKKIKILPNRQKGSKRILETP